MDYKTYQLFFTISGILDHIQSPPDSEEDFHITSHILQDTISTIRDLPYENPLHKFINDNMIHFQKYNKNIS